MGYFLLFIRKLGKLGQLKKVGQIGPTFVTPGKDLSIPMMWEFVERLGNCSAESNFNLDIIFT